MDVCPPAKVRYLDEAGRVGGMSSGTDREPVGGCGPVFFSVVPYLVGQWLNFKRFGITYLVGKIKFELLFQGPLGWVRFPATKKSFTLKIGVPNCLFKIHGELTPPLKADLAHVADVYQLVHVKVPSTCQMVYKGHYITNHEVNQRFIHHYIPLFLAGDLFPYCAKIGEG